MSRDGSNRDFDTILEELHQAIVSEKVAASLVDTGHPEDTDVSLKLEEAAECLRLIERVRQRNTQTAGPFEVAAPEKIGRFQIEEQIGEGSYGFVYRAHDPDLNRKVAIKVPRPEVALSPKLRDRFVREAEVTASLQHPAIVRVLQAGRIGGAQFISSELCSGPTLAQWMKENPGPLEPDHAARLMLVLSEAVHHAHSRGVLHRDLKPGNIMLNQNSSNPADTNSERLADLAQITDFGLALALNADTRDTQTGAIVGTPAYMSPEQADGRIEDFSSASDIYSLGAILYELLTGSPPFQEDSVLATLEAVRSTEPARPSRGIATVPLDLESICLKCLQKDPTHRYQSAAALVDDLRAFLERRPIAARPLGTLERLLRWTKRNPLPSALSAGLVFSVIAGATLFGLQFYKTLVAKERAEEAASLEALVTDFMNRAFQRTSPMVDGKDLKMVDVLAQTRQELDSETDMGPISRGAIYTAIGRTYWGLSQYADARGALTRAIKILPQGHEKRLTARWLLGETYSDDANTAEAIRVLEPLLVDARRLLGEEHELVLKCSGTLADAYMNQRRFDDSRRLLDSLAKSASVSAHLRVANDVSRAKLMAATEKNDDAIELLLETLDSARNLEKAKDHELVRVLSALGTAYLNQGNGDEAKKYLSENLEVRERLFGTNHHHTLGALNDLAGAYFVSRDMDTASEYLERAFKVAKVALGDEHPDTMGMRYNIAVLYLKTDRAVEAVPMFKTVYEWRAQRVGVDDPATKKAARRLAAALEASGTDESTAGGTSD